MFSIQPPVGRACPGGVRIRGRGSDEGKEFEYRYGHVLLYLVTMRNEVLVSAFSWQIFEHFFSDCETRVF